MTPGCENDFCRGRKVGTTFYIGGAKRYTLIDFILILSCVVMLLGKQRRICYCFLSNEDHI